MATSQSTRRLAASLLAALLVAPAAALAQDDEPIPYPDEEEEEEVPKKKRQRSEETYVPREDLPYEEQEREVSQLAYDDPGVGIAGTLVTGLMLLDSSQGAGVEPRFLYGLRFTWDAGRLSSNERIFNGLFVDAHWLYSAEHAGTTEFFGDTNHHYFMVAPAFLIPFKVKPRIGVYFQGGLGFTYENTAFHTPASETQVSGTPFTMQYGAGLRGEPVFNQDTGLKGSFRLELTRFRRGYKDDTLIALSFGAAL